MDLARQNGIEVIEKAISVDELSKADEVFLTGTAAEVTPVGRIDDWAYTPAAITHRLIDAYTKAVGAV